MLYVACVWRGHIGCTSIHICIPPWQSLNCSYIHTGQRSSLAKYHILPPPNLCVDIVAKQCSGEKSYLAKIDLTLGTQNFRGIKSELRGSFIFTIVSISLIKRQLHYFKNSDEIVCRLWQNIMYQYYTIQKHKSRSSWSRKVFQINCCQDFLINTSSIFTLCIP